MALFNFLKQQKKPEQKNVVVVVAAGESRRMQTGRSKLLENVAEKPVIAWTLSSFQVCRYIDEIILVTREEDILFMWDIVREFEMTKVKSVIAGGEERYDSVLNGLSEIEDSDLVLIHDGARPLVSPIDIERTIFAAREYGAAALGVKVRDTVKKVNESKDILETIDRENLYLVQTPQAFNAGVIKEAIKKCLKDGLSPTDECMVAEKCGIAIKMVDGNYQNFKITVPEDLEMAEALLKDWGGNF